VRERVIGPLAMNSSSALRANRSRHVVSQVFCATNRVMVNDAPFPASILRPERLGEHEHDRRRRKLVRNVLDAPLQSPESRVPAPEHFSRLSFRKMRDLFLQQRRRPDGDRRSAAPARGGARGATHSALSFGAVVDARLARPGDGRGSTSARVVRIVRLVVVRVAVAVVRVAIAIAIAIAIVASARGVVPSRALRRRRFVAPTRTRASRARSRRLLRRRSTHRASRCAASSSRSFGSLPAGRGTGRRRSHTRRY